MKEALPPRRPQKNPYTQYTQPTLHVVYSRKKEPATATRPATSLGTARSVEPLVVAALDEDDEPLDVVEPLEPLLEVPGTPVVAFVDKVRYSASERVELAAVLFC